MTAILSQPKCVKYHQSNVTNTGHQELLCCDANFTVGQRKKVTAVTFFRCPTVNLAVTVGTGVVVTLNIQRHHAVTKQTNYDGYRFAVKITVFERYRWFSAGLQYLHCWRIGDNAVLY